jgi:hypothetical protein
MFPAKKYIMILICLISKTSQVSELFKEFTVKNNIIYPTVNQLNKIRKNFEYTIIYYNSSHCQLCQEFSKEYLKIAQELEKQKPDYPVVSVTCNKGEFNRFCTFSEKIKFFPTVRIYHHNEYVEYKGKFDVVKVFLWIRDRTVHSLFKLTKENFNTLKDFLKQGKILTVFYNPGGEKKRQNSKQYSILSTLYHFSRFFETSDEILYKETVAMCDNLKNEKEGEDSIIVVIHPDHHRCYFYSGYIDHKKMISFLKAKEKSMIRLFDEKSIEMSNYYDLPIVILFHQDENNFHFWNDFEELANEYHNQFFFTHINDFSYQGEYRNVNVLDQNEYHIEKKDNDIIHRLMVDLGINKRNWPSLFVFKKKKHLFSKKWKFEGPFEKNNVKIFLEGILKNTLPVFFKHEKLSVLNNENSKFQKLSGLNFENEINKAQKAIVYLEGDEELCSNCSEFAENVFKAYSNLSQKYSDFDYKLFRLNVQLNEVRNWHFDHVPIILVFSNGTDANFIQDYNGIMEEDLIEQFLKQHTIMLSSEL